jgi:hypothetical protein
MVPRPSNSRRRSSSMAADTPSGKCELPRLEVVGRRPTHRVNVQHPAIAKPGECLVDAERDDLALLVGAAGVVASVVQPCGHEGAVLAHDHPVVHHRGVVEQIGQPGIPGAMLFQLQLFIDRTDTGVEREQKQRLPRRQWRMQVRRSLVLLPLAGRVFPEGRAARRVIRLVATVPHVHVAHLRIALAMIRSAWSAPNQSSRPTTVARSSCALKTSAKASNPENMTSSRSPPMNRLSRLPARRIGILRRAMLRRAFPERSRQRV